MWLILIVHDPTSVIRDGFYGWIGILGFLIFNLYYGWIWNSRLSHLRSLFWTGDPNVLCQGWHTFSILAFTIRKCGYAIGNWDGFGIHRVSSSKSVPFQQSHRKTKSLLVPQTLILILGWSNGVCISVGILIWCLY